MPNSTAQSNPSPLNNDRTMQEQFLDMLRYAVGGMETLRLAVTGINGGKPEYFDIDRPFVIIGRAKDCDVPLESASVGFRHAYLQVIGRRVACIDLLSASGVHCDGVPAKCFWLSPEHRFRIGDHWIQLFDDGWSFDAEVPSPLAYKPRNEHCPEYGVLPEVELVMANTNAAGRAWPINRIITLLGRDEGCRITCADEKVSKVHCSLLLLPSGLWAVDLLGRGGLHVNDQPTRCALLSQGSELRIGPYRLRVRYPQFPAETGIEEGAAASAAEASEPGPDAALAAGRSPQAAAASSTAEFLTRMHRIFKLEFLGDTMVVLPQGDIREFMYREIQVEANRIIHVMNTYGYQHLIIDFSGVPLVGSVILEAITSFCRLVRGRAVMCSPTTEMLESLQGMNLHTIWPVYATRQDAYVAVHLPPV